MSITSAAIKNNRITIVALVVIVLSGVSTYFAMPRSKDPGFVIRMAQIITHFPGASPERVEQLVTDPLEKAIREIPELDFVSSQSKTGVSIIFANIKESEKTMRPIWDDLRRKIDRAGAALPSGVLPPIVNDEFGDVFGILVMLTGEGFTRAELEEIAKEARDALMRIDQAAKVEIYGAQEERIFVEYENATLARLGLAPGQLLNVLATRNVIISGGSISTGAERITLEPSGNFESLDALKRTVVRLPGRRGVVALQDIARITRGTIDPPSKITRFMGQDALGIGVSLRKGGNIVSLGEAVRGVLGELQMSYPIGVDFEPVAFLPDDVSRTIEDFEGNLLQSVLIVFLAMLLFLGIRSGLLIATLVPMAMVATFVVMSGLSIGLNQVSLASLIIALGMLVDNAIVMAEAIMVRLADGEERVSAAVGAARELQMPLLISSLTTSAAFLPIFLAESAVGEYTAAIFKVVTIALLCSWVLALTMVCLLAVTFMKVKQRSADKPAMSSRFYGLYRGFILAGLRHKALSLALVVAAFVGGMMLMRTVPPLFFPPDTQPFFMAKLTLPIGAPIERADAVASAVEGFIADELRAERSTETEWNAKRRVWESKHTYKGEGVTTWASFVGGGAPKFVLGFNPDPPTPNYALVIANTTSDGISDELRARVERFALDRFPDLKAKVERLQNGPPVSEPVAVRVTGRDRATLFDLVDKVKARFAEVDGTKEITEDWGPYAKKLVVDIDEARAQRVGATNQDIALSLQTGLSGLSNTDFREGDKTIPITLRSVSADRQDFGKIESLNVYASATSRPVPLGQVADTHLVWEPAVIKRYNGALAVTVSCQVEEGANAVSIAQQLSKTLAQDQKAWPPGYRFEAGGSFEASTKANASIGAKLPIAFFIIIMLLVGQFNSIRRATIVLLTIPLALIGVAIGLKITGSYFGFMTLLGIISLAGIVINNAIVLLDRVRIEIEVNGLAPAHAVIQASQLRLRPIMLTTATTIGGLLPLWLGGGPMWEPMAISIIFGLLFATMLTLGVVPILYSAFFRVKYKDFHMNDYYP